MNRKTLYATAAAAGLLLGFQSASAADIVPEMAASPGWYVSLFGGASFLEDVETEYVYNGTPDFGNEAETDVGFIVGGAIGAHLTDNIRVELEVAYSENDVDKLKYTPPGGDTRTYDAASGQFGILTFMGNLWLDVPLSDEISPYVGGGAGVAIIDGELAFDDFFAGEPIYDSSETAFAFQVGAGLRWKAWENITLDVGYRLRGIEGVTFEENDVNLVSDYDSDWIYSHNVIAGVSLGF